MTTTETITIYGIPCVPVFSRYRDNDRIAILLKTPQGEPVATATINQPDFDLEPDQVLIKNYAENESVLDTLVNAGIIEDTGLTVPVGHAVANVCRLLKTPTVH